MRLGPLANVSAMLVLSATAADAQSWQRIAPGVGYWAGGLDAGAAVLQAHAVRIDLCARGVALRVTAPSERAETTSAWARAVGAVAATNGDYFEGNEPTGPARGHRAWWPAAPRIHHDALIAWGRGRLPRILAAPLSTPALWLDAGTRVDPGESEVLAAREEVLRAGVVTESPQITHDGGRHPRTAIGLSADRHTLWMLVIDGTGESGGGATVSQLAFALGRLGATDGLKLDGGGSSTLFVRSLGVVNHPSDGRERVVANHFGVVLDPSAPMPPACVTPPRRSTHTRRSFPLSPLVALPLAIGFAWAPRKRAPRDTSDVSARQRRDASSR